MCEEEQLSLFGVETQSEPNNDLFIEKVEQTDIATIIPHELEDRVQIIIPEHKKDISEPFFYLRDFVKKRGIVKKVIEKPSLQYEVEVGHKIACVYHDEVQTGWPS